jgi:hypothetical protein
MYITTATCHASKYLIVLDREGEVGSAEVRSVKFCLAIESGLMNVGTDVNALNTFEF